MHQTRPSEGSKRGIRHKFANGEPIPNEGEKQVGFLTDDGAARNMRFQVCDVTKPLASVSRICAKGHKVAFQAGCSYIQNLTTGEVTWLKEANGVYTLDVWMPAQGFSRQIER